MKPKDRLAKLLPAAAMLFLLFRFPREMADGVRRGLTLCGTAVIPSLFPFLAFCTFFVRSGLCAAAGEKLARPTRKLLRLPPAAAGAVLLGLCGGYPVGTRMTAQLLTAGSITRSQAQRMCLFCVAAGPAFVTGTVGASMLGSRAAGWLLFAALTLANLTVGMLLRFTDEEPRAIAPPIPKQPFARCFCEAVAEAGGSMLSVCAWVLLFSGICTALERTPPSVSVPLVCVLEVTNGCKTGAANGLSLPVLAAILGFGGLSVHCQILSDVTACGVKLSRFWAFRVVCGALAAVYCTGLARLFPQAQTVALLRADLPVQAVSASVPTSAALLVTAAVFILNTAKEDARGRTQ
jgi:sporulation integral membrane protein YlbJ